MKEMCNININFDTKTWKKNIGYSSYGPYLCECTHTLYLFKLLVLVFDQEKKQMMAPNFQGFERWGKNNTTICPLGWINCTSCQTNNIQILWCFEPSTIPHHSRQLKTKKNDEHMIYFFKSKSCLHLL